MKKIDAGSEGLVISGPSFVAKLEVDVDTERRSRSGTSLGADIEPETLVILFLEDLTE